MELTYLKPENEADEPADQRAQDTAADDVQRVVDAYVYLSVGNNKRPQQDERPPAADRSECAVDKNGHREMVAGVGRSKAGANGAIVGQEADRVVPKWIAAGAKTVDMFLHQVAADEIADDDGHSQVE